MATRLAFVSVGMWWLIFSIPLFLRVPEPRALASDNPQPVSIAGGFRQLVGTFHELRKYRQALLFLAAFLIYNDGIQTMIRMATIYGEGIGIDTGAMITALLLTQFIGVPAAFAFGAVASRIGAKTGILIGLAVYAGDHRARLLHEHRNAFLRAGDPGRAGPGRNTGAEPVGLREHDPPPEVV